jgi:hypothetical protein
LKKWRTNIVDNSIENIKLEESYDSSYVNTIDFDE